MMNSQSTENLYTAAKLPDNPGIYFFKDKEGNILYIGRATSLRDRVRSYFMPDLIATRGPLLVDMVTKAAKIEFIETDSVLEAIILESNKIKEHQPYYNTKEKDNRSYNYVVITDEEFPRLLVVRGRTLQVIDEELREIILKFKIKAKFGPYPEGGLLREALKIIRKIFPFRDAKSVIPHQERFYQSIGLSPNTSSPEAKKEYQKTIRNLILFFQGKKGELMKTLEKEMKEYAATQKFEKADRVKHTIYALMHIEDIALIKSDAGAQRHGFRIEAYDIAHMSGKNTVGVMTVIIDDELEKDAYRKFRIIREANDDTAGIKEVLLRRFNHPEWPYPNLIVIDGGLGQKNAAEALLKEIGTSIPVVSVVKNAAHKPDHFLGDEKLVAIYSKAILKANAEAHRFAIAYHKNLRKRTFFGRK